MLLRQLSCFVTVARTGSFTAAARALNLSQPSLGSHVRQLEGRYGVALFVRGARGVALTEAGQVFLPQAQRVLHEAERAEQALAGLRGDVPWTLRLGITPTSEVTLLPDLLQRCGERQPPIRLDLRQGLSEALIDAVTADRLDAALCYDIAPHDEIVTVALYSEDLFLVGPPDVASAATEIAFDRLGSVPLVLDRRFGAIRRRIEETANARDLRLDVQQEVEPADIKRALVRRHGCFTIVPFGLFSDDIRQGRMAAWRIVAPRLTRTLHLAVRRGAPPEPARTIGNWLAEIVAAALRSDDLGWRHPIGEAEGKSFSSPPKSVLGTRGEAR